VRFAFQFWNAACWCVNNFFLSPREEFSIRFFDRMRQQFYRYNWSQPGTDKSPSLANYFF
jgi:hypothetical protein